MRAFDNESEHAVAICANCGRALSRQACQVTETNKVVCSAECRAALVKFDTTIGLIYSRALLQHRSAAYGLFLTGTIFLIFGLYQLLFRFAWLGALCVAMAAGCGIWGAWQLRLERRPGMARGKKRADAA